MQVRTGMENLPRKLSGKRKFLYENVAPANR